MNAVRLEVYGKNETDRAFAMNEAKKASQVTGKRYQVSRRRVSHARHWCLYTLGKIRDKR